LPTSSSWPVWRNRRHLQLPAVGWQSATDTSWAVTLVGCVRIVAMTRICLVGLELNAATQRWLLSAEMAIPAVFAVRCRSA
jgi:hypothetical protein